MVSRIRLQPLVNLSDRTIFGYEALYQRNTGRFPSAISIAKNIIKCREPNEDEYCMSINMTSCDLMNRCFAKSILKLLDQNKVDPSRLILEIGENTASSILKDAVETLSELRKNNIHIALDDFGVSFSVINFTQNVPADFIKIDQSFIQQNPKNGRALKTLQHFVEIAKDSNCEIIAEGIESQEHLDLVQKSNINIGQGFLFSTENNSAFISLNEFYITKKDAA